MKIKFLLLFCTPLSISAIFGQNTPVTNVKDSEYRFTPIYQTGTTDVKNQFKSNTCWTYATNSFLESELLREGKGKNDLSELFIVRNMYLEKAEKYVRMLGKTQFAAGGQAHDVMHTIRTYGILPQSVYAGGQPLFEHLAFDDSLAAYMSRVVKMQNGVLDAHWKDTLQHRLDAYFGVPPTSFEVNGKTYTPQSYAKALGIDPDNYIEIGSYTHHPYYQSFILECPDNWAWASIWNVPLNEFTDIVDYALSKGYSVNWDADVSEKFFSHKNGLAIVPRDTAQLNFLRPIPEAVITPEMRQVAFDNLSTQDDHLMHIVGMVKDATGNTFYVVKNSWGTERNSCGGFLYVSKAYFQYKTISIQVHKKALPKAVKAKLKF